MYSIKRLMYERSPLLIKQCIGRIPFHWIAGSAYRNVRDRDLMIRDATAGELQRMQCNLLRNILRQATRHVPAYRQFREAVEEMPPEEALQQFPLIDKTALKAGFDQYRADHITRFGSWESSTGGTSGDQLHFVLDDGAQSREMGFIHRIWSQVGYSPRSQKATFRGVEFRNSARSVYWQENPVYNECQFSPFHLSPKTVDNYLRKLREYAPEYIHGYPSAVSLLAEFLLQRNEVLPVRGVLLGSETVFPDQRSRIESAFSASVLSWYGHSERVILAGECESCSAYHAIPDYGWLEIVDENGRQVEEGETGELVGTGFWNEAMPLIRYRTGDRARRLPRSCACGREFERFDEVEGRWQQEYVIGHSGARISVAALNMHGTFYDRVIRYQYFQSRPGFLQLRILPGTGFGQADIDELLKAFERRVAQELSVEVVLVDEIPLTSRGKFKRLIQQIADQPSRLSQPV